MNKIRWGILVIPICVVLLILSGCKGKSSSANSQLVNVVSGNLTVLVSGNGRISVATEAKLAFGVGGRVNKIYVKEGDAVKKGTTLAELETDTLELAVTQAEVALAQAQLARETAEDQLTQAQDTYSKNEVLQARQTVGIAQQYVIDTQSKLDQASAAYEITVWTNELAYAKEQLRIAQVRLDELLAAPDTKKVTIAKLNLAATQQSVKLAEQSLEQSKKQLKEATITAPFDGMVAEVNAEEGDVILPPTLTSTVIVHLIDTAKMELKVQVDEVDIPGVKTGQKAIIKVDALPSLNLGGKVSLVGLVATENAGVFVYDVTLEFDVPDNSGLKVGMSATADIVTAERKNVLLVPDGAITENSQGNQIVEVMVNGKISERPVVVGISDGLKTEVFNGLKEGETVVTH